jgi:type VI secretion system protein VasG
MKSKDLASLLHKLNNYLVRSLDTATGFAIKRNQYEVTVEHLLVAILEDGQGDVPLILKQYAVDGGRVHEKCLKNLEEMEPGNPGKPRLSRLLTDMLQEAWMAASVHHGENKIRSGALFEVFIASDLVIATGLMGLLEKINQEDLRANFGKIVAGSVESADSSMELLSSDTVREAPADATVLDLYTMNLTKQAKEGMIDPVLGRDDEIIQIIEILSRRKKSNPILLGEPGVGKTAVVEGLALRIAHEEIPEILKGVRIHSLDLGALQAGTKMRGEFEQRLKAVINEVTKSARQIILFIDEAHTLIGAGGTAGGGDAANLLKPSLARGELRAIAATTYLEYNKYFAKDAALERRFQPVHIGEPEDEKAILMLRGIKDKYEAYHGIHITDGALEAAVKLSRRYISGRQLPDKAVDLLDTSATRVKMSVTSKPPGLELLSSTSKSVGLEIASVRKDSDLYINENAEYLEKLTVRRTELETEIKTREDKWNKEREMVQKLMELRKQRFTQGLQPAEIEKIVTELKDTQHKIYEIQGETPNVFSEVTPLTVAEVIESWTGIQVGQMTRDEMTTLMSLEAELQKRVVGQDHAIKQIADSIRGAKVGLKKEEGPIGVYMMVGTSGVGKTELARAVAEVLFGDERFMVTLNMTEYQNEYNTSRLIGADPGLVGYGEGGALSEPVRRRPYCVVLLDEIEKANHAVIDLFMQVFDRGMLQDADRRLIDFSNTLIFMTSNLASEVLFEKYNEGMTNPDELLEELRPYLNHHFRPEFLGRIKPVVFLPLGAEVMKRITLLKLGKLGRRLKQNRNIDVTFGEDIVDHIVAACTRAETGARNIDAIVDRRLTPDISAKLLGYLAEGRAPSSLTVNLGEDGEYQFSFNEPLPA